MGFASFVTVVPCSSCSGKGSIIETPCIECKGTGKKKGTKKIEFEIPPGIDNGDYTIPNEGDEIPGGINGDLIVRIRVQPHQEFKRDGADIFYDQNVSMIDGALGKDVTVPILNGTEKIKIDSGCQPNTIIKLKGKGLPRMNSRKIALDVDGVIADVIESWLIYSNKIRSPISKEEITNWDFWKKFKINRYDFYKELTMCWKNWNTLPPMEPNLSQITKNLSEFGQVDIVTARELSTDNFVKNWLKLHGIVYENYVSVIDGTMKADLDYDLFIDDSPLNAKRFVENEKNFFLYSQPWNKHIPTKNQRIFSLSDAVNQLSAKI
jgi:5'(3')-deoxyribonucleotidase